MIFPQKCGDTCQSTTTETTDRSIILKSEGLTRMRFSQRQVSISEFIPAMKLEISKLLFTGNVFFSPQMTDDRSCCHRIQCPVQSPLQTPQTHPLLCAPRAPLTLLTFGSFAPPWALSQVHLAQPCLLHGPWPSAEASAPALSPAPHPAAPTCMTWVTLLPFSGNSLSPPCSRVAAQLSPGALGIGLTLPAPAVPWQQHWHIFQTLT